MEKECLNFLQYLATNRTEILENFCRAYLCETGLSPLQVKMVIERKFENNVFHEKIWFIPKEA